MAWFNGADVVYSPMEDVVYVDNIPYYSERTCTITDWRQACGGFVTMLSCGHEIQLDVAVGNYCPNCGAKVVK